MPGSSKNAGHFPTTAWSLVALAGREGPEQREALTGLLLRYLPAMRSHLVRRLRLPADQVDDALQGFLADRIMERSLLGAADPQRGRFRSLLVTSLNHYVYNLQRARSAQVRGGSVQFDPAGAALDAAHLDGEPSLHFHQEWARQMIRQALEQMREHCAAVGRDDVWAVFEGRVVEPLLFGAAPVPYEDLAARHGLDSTVRTANVLVTGKRMFARFLRRQAGQYLSDPAEIDREIDDLKAICSGRHPGRL